MTVGTIVTDNDTHSPEKWADYALACLVPIEAGASHEVIGRVITARLSMRESVVEALEAAREADRKALQRLTPGEEDMLAQIIRRHHGAPVKDTPELSDMDRWSRSGAVSAEDLLDRHVRKIVKTASNGSGISVSHNEAIDRVYEVIRTYINSVHLAERSWHVTSHNR